MHFIRYGNLLELFREIKPTTKMFIAHEKQPTAAAEYFLRDTRLRLYLFPSVLFFANYAAALPVFYWPSLIRQSVGLPQIDCSSGSSLSLINIVPSGAHFVNIRFTSTRNRSDIETFMLLWSNVFEFPRFSGHFWKKGNIYIWKPRFRVCLYVYYILSTTMLKRAYRFST